MGEWKPCDHCPDPMDCGSWATCLSPHNGYQHKPKPPEPEPEPWKPSESVKQAWEALCELERRLTPPVQLAFNRIECRTCGLGADDCRCHPGKYIVTCNPAPDSWVRRKFTEEPK